ncbi:MAG: o-succinylbenzoate synthase [Balneolaceae bacterium]|nr:o-succinylbenzoate synthase [Balneolaceae bacterium]MBO6547733.1 o-succinylbenzoate synthase [Balneolaceae bacterium]MBO6648244.1 o-succinylbenzoate synthase [Balneolaceae bacterium]
MLRFFKYSIPFKKPFKTASDEFKTREGIVLVFEHEDIQAYGEVAPLPGFSSETLVQTEVILQQNKKFLEQAFLNNDARQIITVLDQIHQFPSLSFGLDILWHDFQSKKEKKSLSDYLFGLKKPLVDCNTAIGIQSEKEMLAHIKQKKEEGFNTFKLKVGADFNKEKSALEFIRKTYPDIKLRIDANQAWDKESSVKNLNSIEHLDIEYCEQPVPAPDIEGLAWVKNRTEIKIAADESLGNKKLARELILQNNCDLIIIKPALMGLFENITVTKELANTHNIEVVFTTSLDGIVGRKASAILASGLGTKVFAHGLATGSLLEEQGAHSERFINGSYIISETQGIGNSIDLTFWEEI